MYLGSLLSLGTYSGMNSPQMARARANFERASTKEKPAEKYAEGLNTNRCKLMLYCTRIRLTPAGELVQVLEKFDQKKVAALTQVQATVEQQRGSRLRLPHCPFSPPCTCGERPIYFFVLCKGIISHAKE